MCVFTVDIGDVCMIHACHDSLNYFTVFSVHPLQCHSNMK